MMGKDKKTVTDRTDAGLRIAGDAFVAEGVVVEQNFSNKEAASGGMFNTETNVIFQFVLRRANCC